MYTSADREQAQQSWLRYWVWTAVGFVLLVGCCAVFCIFRWNLPGYIVLSLGLSAFYFTWDLIGRPAGAYRRFLSDMDSGLQKQIIGVFTRETQPSVQDGVAYTRYAFWVDGDAQQVRYLYVDVRKELPPFVWEGPVQVILFGNIVKAVERQESENGA